MYQVMIVDDEPAAVNLLKTLIEKKIDRFEPASIAYDGKEALDILEKQRPDVLITDIQMPVISGLELVRRAKELYPDLVCVIVSGYQEFEYAKQAIQYGVTEYILKPIVPSDMRKLFEKIGEKLGAEYYRQRNLLIHRMVNEVPVKKEDLRRYFQSGRYYGAVVRRNGLPCRFGDNIKTEVFSDINEWMITYGRDDQETLYLCPEEIVYGDYVEMIQRQIKKEQPEAAYVTTVIFRKSVTGEEIGTMVRELYRVLDGSIILGKDQMILKDDGKDFAIEQDKNYDFLENLEYLAKSKKFDRLKKEAESLIHRWEDEDRTQLWMESRVRQICYLLQRYGLGGDDYREYEYLLDEAFVNAGSGDQLIGNLSDMFFKDQKEEELDLQKQSTEDYFEKIKEFIRNNMARPLSLQSVSKEMGVSQTYLSRLFRKYEDISFNNYLTSLRMEKAKELLKSEEKIFVKDVAEQVGYKDQFYFSRIFHTYTGVRPSEYITEKR